MKYECAPTSTGAHFAIYAKASHQSYSRRKIMTKKKKVLLIVSLLVLGCAFIGIGVPVSYTHLDVYKRQAVYKACRLHFTGRSISDKSDGFFWI